jgi:uncharacterized membrane protein
MTIEIIPNWHPILVHFTVALLSISTLFYVLGFALKKEHFLLIARWNLWIGVLITVGTLLAGLYAYNTVVHDDVSHVAMTDHRNWALVTASVFVLLALWAFLKQRGAKTVSPVFVALMVLASGLLATTGYKGGDVVYRYGLGVLSTPDMRSHALIQHEDEPDAAKAPEAVRSSPSDLPETNKTNPHDHGDHPH